MTAGAIEQSCPGHLAWRRGERRWVPTSFGFSFHPADQSYRVEDNTA